MDFERKKKKRYSKDEALEAMQRYCVYQDRCHQEVRYKLIEHQVYGDDLEEVISALIKDNFLNEERFARAYASGKFKIKSWGRNKIKMELKRREISDYCIRKAMTEIDEEDYYSALQSLLRKRWDGESQDYPTRVKLNQYAQSRGFEYGIVKEVVDELFRG